MVILQCIGPDSFFIEKAISLQEIFSSMAPEGSHLEIWGMRTYGPNFQQRLRVSASKTVGPVAA